MKSGSAIDRELINRSILVVGKDSRIGVHSNSRALVTMTFAQVKEAPNPERDGAVTHHINEKIRKCCQDYVVMRYAIHPDAPPELRWLIETLDEQLDSAARRANTYHQIWAEEEVAHKETRRFKDAPLWRRLVMAWRGRVT